jgi:hypothetical protein
MQIYGWGKLNVRRLISRRHCEGGKGWGVRADLSCSCDNAYIKNYVMEAVHLVSLLLQCLRMHQLERHYVYLQGVVWDTGWNKSWLSFMQALWHRERNGFKSEPLHLYSKMASLILKEHPLHLRYCGCYGTPSLLSVLPGQRLHSNKCKQMDTELWYRQVLRVCFLLKKIWRAI